MAEGRKAISKAMRQQVYDSLNGHCGYCGCKITIKEMQVDHIEAVYLHEKELKAGKVPEINSIENYIHIQTGEKVRNCERKLRKSKVLL